MATSPRQTGSELADFIHTGSTRERVTLPSRSPVWVGADSHAINHLRRP